MLKRTKDFGIIADGCSLHRLSKYESKHAICSFSGMMAANHQKHYRQMENVQVSVTFLTINFLDSPLVTETATTSIVQTSPLNEPRHDKTNKMNVRPAKPQISLDIRCPHEESLGPFLPTERTAKALIRLGVCPS